MHLFFETYLITTLLFTILIFYIAELFFKNKKHTIFFIIMIPILVVVIPYFLILLQRVYGSLGEIYTLGYESLMWHSGITVEDSKHLFVTEPTALEAAAHYFNQNFGFIILSIFIGIVCGILAHLLLKKMRVTNSL
jgi:uncharacterized membrane protein YeaQ/YmgE (transglycosylase-associated protein family)